VEMTRGDLAPPEAEVVITRDQLKRRVNQLGEEIGDHYRRQGGDGELCLIAVLKGSFIFLADLVRSIHHPLLLDFLGISGYGDTPAGERGGSVRFTKDVSLDIHQRDVLLVEDIVDTGLTLSYIIGILMERRPRSLEVCALLDRKRRRIADIPISFVGFEVGEEFLVGYGLDRDHLYRNLPDIYRLP